MGSAYNQRLMLLLVLVCAGIVHSVRYAMIVGKYSTLLTLNCNLKLISFPFLPFLAVLSYLPVIILPTQPFCLPSFSIWKSLWWLV